ncbi:hypothetical protein [Pectobacterium brasiliense]|uniref:hypothetical protein n=1 Tax=Pectobacterium brasiliense TaxID=180957 RepID=UPI0025A0B647|nr:hypothetical protein [Pectobacterium brasiliense]WJM81181.1 hypothetical protein QTI90_23900 [Pectobacterium brasiliense]
MMYRTQFFRNRHRLTQIAQRGFTYAQADPADLAAWASLLHVGGMRVDGGSGRLQAWAQLRARRITGVTVDADLQQVRLSGAALPDETARRTLVWERLRARARWQTIEGIKNQEVNYGKSTNLVLRHWHD